MFKLKLGIGTAQFGSKYGIANQKGKVFLNEQKLILNYAKKSGIEFLDTAISYGNSEKNLGKLGVAKFKTISKIPMIPENLQDIDRWIYLQVQKSLSKLKIKNLYGVLLHRSTDCFLYNGRVIRSLINLKKIGLVKKIGISIYSPNELENIFNNFDIDIVQAPFSIVDQRIKKTGWLKKLKKKNVEVHVRSVFLQGLLLMPQNKIPPKFLPWKNLWSKWHSLQIKYSRSISPLQLCLGFVNSIKEIDCVIVGIDNLKQLKAIISSKNIPKIKYPNISSIDENLLHPYNWKNL